MDLTLPETNVGAIKSRGSEKRFVTFGGRVFPQSPRGIARPNARQRPISYAPSATGWWANVASPNAHRAGFRGGGNRSSASAHAETFIKEFGGERMHPQSGAKGRTGHGGGRELTNPNHEVRMIFQINSAASVAHSRAIPGRRSSSGQPQWKTYQCGDKSRTRICDLRSPARREKSEPIPSCACR
jgi:hypothetical protein